MKKLVRRGVEAMALASLRTSFCGVYWAGAAEDFLFERPVIFYANHHSFFDGHLLWLLTSRVLRRKTTIWMQELDRYPFFASGVVLPFPPGDHSRRASAIRRTRRRFDRDPRHALILFPEGQLHPREEGIMEFDEQKLIRVAAIFRGSPWCPTAIHISWRDADRPDAFMATRPLSEHPPEHVARDMQDMLSDLEVRSLSPMPCILRGRTSVHERWNFSSFFRLFSPFE